MNLSIVPPFGLRYTITAPYQSKDPCQPITTTTRERVQRQHQSLTRQAYDTLQHPQYRIKIANMTTVALSTMQRYSKPADPTAWSFLGLPGEIRNGIYEALFKMSDPIKIVREGLECKERHSDSTVVLGTSLLVSCQQIYTEAIGILYGQNIFLFISKSTDDTYVPLEEVAGWLTGIGRLAPLVRSVLVELASVDDFDPPIYVLPVLKQLWKHENSKLCISFTRRSPEEFDLNPSGADVDMINMALSLLKADATLQISKFGPFSRLLQMVSLRPDGRSGRVTFYSPVYFPRDRLYFTVDRSGIHTAFRNQDPPSLTLIMDDWDLRRRIVDYVVPSRGTVTFDLLGRTVSPPLPTMLWTNHQLREAAAEVYARNTFEVKLTLFHRKACSFAGQLGALAIPFLEVRDALRHDGYWSYPFTIILRFDLLEVANLSDVRFDAVTLINATKRHCGSVNLRVELANYKSDMDRQFTMQLSDLRLGVLVALDDFSQKHPSHNEGEGPTVWVDGKGVARELDLTTVTNQVVNTTNSYADKSLSIIKQEAGFIYLAHQGRKHQAENGEESNDDAPLARYVRLFCSTVLSPGDVVGCPGLD